MFTHMGERKHSEPLLDDVFLALSHPTRRRMLELLQTQPTCVTDLAGSFDLSLNVVSKHLKSLERAKLVARSREGRVHMLEAKPEAMQPASAWISQHLAMWQGALNHLEKFLSQPENQ